MVDSITTEVIRHSMLSAAQEMARNLCRTAYNTIVYEIHDYGIGLGSRPSAAKARARSPTTPSAAPANWSRKVTSAA